MLMQLICLSNVFIEWWVGEWVGGWHQSYPNCFWTIGIIVYFQTPLPSFTIFEKLTNRSKATLRESISATHV